MERSDLLSANGGIFKPQGQALSASAKKDVKILVVGNPANTNALIAQQNAPDLDPGRFTAMTRLDHNRAISQLAAKTGTAVTDVTKMTIWGNHSVTQYPDLFHAEVNGQERLRADQRPRVGRRHLHPHRRQARRRHHRGTRCVVGGLGGERRGRSHPLVVARHAPRATGSAWPSPATVRTACPRVSSRSFPCTCKDGDVLHRPGPRHRRLLAAARSTHRPPSSAEERDAVKELGLI